MHMKAGVSDEENSIFPEAKGPDRHSTRHLILRAVVIGCFMLLVLVSGASLVQIFQMAGLLTGPILGYLIVVPGVLVLAGLAAGVLLAMGRRIGWQLALATAIFLLEQQLAALLVQWAGGALPADLRWPLWLAGTLLTIGCLSVREFRQAFGVTFTAFRTALLAWAAVGLALALLLQSL